MAGKNIVKACSLSGSIYNVTKCFIDMKARGDIVNAWVPLQSCWIATVQCKTTIAGKFAENVVLFDMKIEFQIEIQQVVTKA